MFIRMIRAAIHVCAGCDLRGRTGGGVGLGKDKETLGGTDGDFDQPSFDLLDTM